MNKPTKKQAALLKFIDTYMIENDHSPSYREIQNALGLGSVATVAQHIDNCVAAGFLKKTPNAARSLEVIPFEEHNETTVLLRRKIYELNQQIIEGGAELSDNKLQSIKDDIITLKSAAKILDIDL
jgi:SOS-response transcriptional repressor LexA